MRWKFLDDKIIKPIKFYKIAEKNQIEKNLKIINKVDYEIKHHKQLYVFLEYLKRK